MLKMNVTSIFAVLILIGGLLIEAAVAQDKTSAPRVETAAGTIEGVNNSGVYEYKGIPFAKPPVGRLRWKPPQPLDPWSGVRSTKNFGPRCIQRALFEEMVFRSYGMSEDCLYLNIWSPTNQEGAGLPVLVYFYGGELMAGDGSEPRYDGENMARTKGIVTLTVNYRLSVFGFFAHPELTLESPNNASGNYGLLDQVAALRWVKQNISQFGGDPNQITIAGESAGSMSVSALMASPLSRDLIAGAIGESGSIMGTYSTTSLEQAERKGVNFQKAVGADSVGQLRDMSFEKLINVMNNPRIENFSVAVDGYFLPKRPAEIYHAGEQADVPLMVGWNSQEMSYQTLFAGDEPTPRNYKNLINNLYPFNAERVLELYPGGSKEQVIQSAEDLTTDRFIRFSTWKWSDIHAETSNSPVFRYYYTHMRPPKVMTNENSSSTSGGSGAEYSAEIEYLMGNLPANPKYDWRPRDFKVSAIFQGFAANFIKEGNPNGLGLPEWDPLSAGETTPNVMQIDVDARLITGQNQQRYELLNSLQYPGLN